MNERSARSIKIEDGGDLYTILIEMNKKLESIYRQSSTNNSHIENDSRGSQIKRSSEVYEEIKGPRTKNSNSLKMSKLNNRIIMSRNSQSINKKELEQQVHSIIDNSKDEEYEEDSEDLIFYSFDENEERKV